jgi:hypothetical protein
MNMDIIYGHAVMTIILASASSANDCNLQHLPMDSNANDRYQLGHAAFQSLQRRVTNRLGAEVVFGHPTRQDRTSKLDFVYPTRAWTFQEEMLSRRLLYVSSLGSFYVCRRHRIPEVLGMAGIGAAVVAMWNTRLYPLRSSVAEQAPNQLHLLMGNLDPFLQDSLSLKTKRRLRKSSTVF